MKLAYRDTDSAAPGLPVVVLHGDGTGSIDLTGVARAVDGLGRVVAPFGDYAHTANGMEVAGTCWYRILPGYEGTDPVSLTKAVVQVCDLLDDLALGRPALIGCGQGGVVALGAGLLRADEVGPVVCVDASPAHVELLPPAALAGPGPRLLLVATAASRAAALGELRAHLAAHRIDSDTWQWSGDAEGQARDDALTRRIGGWLEEGGGR
ncbi:MAG TPA: alpha/beta hydrolase [Acidimicrobiales bacterium]|nr:alpha/beta hydrolase [Acidimicrobiales bacterium]